MQGHNRLFLSRAYALTCHVSKRLACAVAIFIYWYLGSYVLLMDWRCGAFDTASNNWASESHYRMAHSDSVVISFTMVVPLTCWANQLFWPIDTLLKWVKSMGSVEETPTSAMAVFR